MNQEANMNRDYLSWFGGGGMNRGAMDNNRNINIDLFNRGGGGMFINGGFGVGTGATNQFDSNSIIS